MAEQTPNTSPSKPSTPHPRPQSPADVAKEIQPSRDVLSVDPLAGVALAWIDRWKALGGDFGRVQRDDGNVVTLGRLIEPSLWHPTDRDRDDLPPHVWFVEPEHHVGGVKALEGLLTLSPALRDAVRAIAAKQFGGVS